MLDRGDLELNSVQSCQGPLQQRVKQTMLNQELVFMGQVYELHRLYRNQVAMMEDYKWKGMDEYNLHRRDLNPLSLNQNNQATCSMAEFQQSANLNAKHGLSGSMKKPLDLQLSADEFIGRRVDNFSGKDFPRDPFKRSIDLNISSADIIVTDHDNLKLSLSIGQDFSKQVEDHRYWMANKTCASSSNVIDLEEESQFSFSTINPYLGRTHSFAASNFRRRDKVECFSLSGMTGISYKSPPSRSLLENGPSCQRQAPTVSGYNKQHKEFFSADLSINNQTSTSSKAINLDLNMVQPEEASHFMNNHSMVHKQLMFRTSFSSVSDMVYPKCIMASSVSPTSRTKENISYCNESSDVRRHLDLNIDLAENYRHHIEDNGRGKISSVDLDSDSGEDLCSSRSKLESVGSSSKFSNSLSCALEKNAERSDCQKLSSSSESDSIIRDQSSSLKTMQSGVQCVDLNFYTSDERLKTDFDNSANHSEEQDQKSSNSTESNIQCSDRKEPEVDEMVQTAAELLVRISSEYTVFHQGESAKLPLKESENDEDDQPQCSSESYEVMVLNAKECGSDDYCVSSGAFVVDVSEKKDCGYKLKRGTRMKDFQKDILPCLSILSRHDMREDINILKGVIRSREYKRMRAKMGGDEGDWFKPSRSKRSRVGNSRR